MTVFAGAALLLGLWAIFLHANVRLRFGVLEQVVATPAFHHWHHDRHARGNYAGLFPWVDTLFGTNVTREDWPVETGTADAPVEGYWAHVTLQASGTRGGPVRGPDTESATRLSVSR